MDNGEYATTFVMSELWDELRESDCNGKGVSCLAKIYNKIKGDKDVADMFSGLQDISYPKSAK